MTKVESINRFDPIWGYVTLPLSVWMLETLAREYLNISSSRLEGLSIFTASIFIWFNALKIFSLIFQISWKKNQELVFVRNFLGLGEHKSLAKIFLIDKKFWGQIYWIYCINENKFEIFGIPSKSKKIKQYIDDIAVLSDANFFQNIHFFAIIMHTLRRSFFVLSCCVFLSIAKNVFSWKTFIWFSVLAIFSSLASSFHHWINIKFLGKTRANHPIHPYR